MEAQIGLSKKRVINTCVVVIRIRLLFMDLSGLRFPMFKTTEQTTERSSRSSCGNNWQSEYARLHRNILAGRQPPRYLIALGTGGLADSLAGAITLFWVALLTNRAFLMDMGDGIKYEFAYDQPTINWSLDIDSIRLLPSETLQMAHGRIVGRSMGPRSL
jgi:hypothetical protein